MCGTGLGGLKVHSAAGCSGGASCCGFCASASRPRRLAALALGCSRSGSASSMEAGTEICLRLGFRIWGFWGYFLGVRVQAERLRMTQDPNRKEVIIREPKPKPARP